MEHRVHEAEDDRSSVSSHGSSVNSTTRILNLDVTGKAGKRKFCAGCAAVHPHASEEPNITAFCRLHSVSQHYSVMGR